MENLPERIRIKDIARLAEVSVGTVDRVLHGRPGVSKSSKERVEKILKELNYQPNVYASALASNKKFLITYILPEHGEGSYWCDIEKGIKQGSEVFTDFHLSIAPIYYDPYTPETFDVCIQKVMESKPDGVVISPTLPEKTFSLVGELNKAEIPFVFIDSNLPELNPLAFFGQDSVQSGYFAGSMLMLLAQEERQVVIFRHVHGGGAKLMNQQRFREKGFRNYMEKYHPDCLILELDIDVKLSIEERHALLDNFFNAHPHIKCGLTFNSQVGVFGEYIEQRGINNFRLLGYDLLDRNVKCLKNGSVRFLIAQQPIQQGYTSIDELSRHLIFKKEVKQLNFMPIDLLTADNVDYYPDILEKETKQTTT